MGISNFTQVFLAECEVKNVSELNGKTIAIDAMAEIYMAALSSTKMHYIQILMNNIIKWRGINMIWCFDNPNTNTDKAHELEKRKQRRDAAQKKLDELSNTDNVNDDELESLQRQTFKVTAEMIHSVQSLLSYLNIVYITAPQGFEGESVAAYLSEINKVDGVYSTDSDVIPFGANTHYYRSGSKIFKFTKADIIAQINEATFNDNCTMDDLLKICVVLGCDFAKKTPRIGPKTVFNKYKSVTLTDEQLHAIEVFKKSPNIDTSFVVKKISITDHANLAKLFDSAGISKVQIEKWCSKISTDV